MLRNIYQIAQLYDFKPQFFRNMKFLLLLLTTQSIDSLFLLFKQQYLLLDVLQPNTRNIVTSL